MKKLALMTIFIFLFSSPLLWADEEGENSSKGLSLTVEGQKLKDYVSNLLHKKTKVREEAWKKIVNLGPQAVPALQELSQTSPPALKKILQRLIWEIHFQQAQKNFSPPSPLAQSELIGQLKSASKGSKKEELLQNFGQKVDRTLLRLQSIDAQPQGLVELQQWGILSAHELQRAQITQEGQPGAYLARRLFKSQIGRWKKLILDEKTKEESLVQAGYLIAPVLKELLKAKKASSRKKAQKILEKINLSYLSALGHSEYGYRLWARRSLYHLGDLALPFIEKAKTTSSPHVQYMARRLEVQIRWKINDELWAKVGPVMENFEKKSRREQKRILFDMEKIAKRKAILPLRQILSRLKDEEVKLMAAQSLSRLGDPQGLRYLQRAQIQGLLNSSPDVLASFHIQKGIRALEARNFEEGLRHFQKVLKIQSDNKIALYNLACLYSLWKKPDRSFEYLEKAIRAGFLDLDHMNKDPDLDNIRDDPRYKNLYKLANRLRKERQR